MSDTILVKVIMPSQIVFQEDATMVNIPGGDGVFGVLPKHVKLISTIQVGVVTIFTKGEEKKFFVYGGMAQVDGALVNIVTEFAVSLAEQNKADILNKIADLKAELANVTKNNLEEGILNDTIAKYNALLNFVG